MTEIELLTQITGQLDSINTILAATSNMNAVSFFVGGISGLAFAIAASRWW